MQRPDFLLNKFADGWTKQFGNFLGQFKGGLRLLVGTVALCFSADRGWVGGPLGMGHGHLHYLVYVQVERSALTCSGCLRLGGVVAVPHLQGSSAQTQLGLSRHV